MRKTTKLTYLLGALALFSISTNSAFAVGDGDPMQRRLEMMKEKLNLSEDQYNQIKTVMTAQRDLCAKETTFEAEKSCRQNGRQETRQKVEAILTPEQKTRFAELREQRREGGGNFGHGGERRGGKRGGRGR